MLQAGEKRAWNLERRSAAEPAVCQGHGWVKSPAGFNLLRWTEDALLAWSFADAADSSTEPSPRDDSRARELAERFWAAAPGSSLTLAVGGTAFQFEVWAALIEVGPGTVVTYSEIARRLGRPKAARAVGSAVGANALACVIPCHRVVPRNGMSKGYAWGLERKNCLLAQERFLNGSGTACAGTP